MPKNCFGVFLSARILHFNSLNLFMDCVSCRPVPLLCRPRPQEPRTASEKVKLCKFMVLRWRDWGARTRASALVPRNFVALPSRVLLMYCDSARSLRHARGVKF